MVSNGVDRMTAAKVAPQIVSKMQMGVVDPKQNDLDDPADLGIESSQNEQIRHLVRMVVDEEIRLSRRG